jgi:hypothetical protein
VCWEGSDLPEIATCPFTNPAPIGICLLLVCTGTTVSCRPWHACWAAEAFNFTYLHCCSPSLMAKALLPSLTHVLPDPPAPTHPPTEPSPEKETLTKRSTWGPCRTVPRSRAWSTRMIVICTCTWSQIPRWTPCTQCCCYLFTGFAMVALTADNGLLPPQILPAHRHP